MRGNEEAGWGGGEGEESSNVEGSYRKEFLLEEANPMSGVFQSIDPLTTRRECSPPAFGAERGHTRGEGVGSQYFGRRQKLLCTLHT
jgi:hypothetical protein